MTAITRNLPSFVRDIGVSIIGEGCYVSLVEDLNVADVKCLKYAVSKGLGIGIVLGGSIMKVPQLLLIVNAGSARGLSHTAYVLETLSYAITMVYSARNNFPFSTYGENLFLTLQNVIITFLIIAYTPRRLTSNVTSKAALTAVGALATAVVLYTVPSGPLALLQLSTLPLSLFSKLPQIRQNHRAQSTGQLSVFAIASQIAGCLARLFTTAQEVGDPLVASAFGLALILNLVLGVQLYQFWGQDDRDTREARLEEIRREKEPVRVALNERPSSGRSSPAPYNSSWDASPQRVATPPPSTGDHD